MSTVTIAEKKRQLLPSHLINDLKNIIIDYARPFVEFEIPNNDNNTETYDSIRFAWTNSKYTNGCVNIRGTRIYFIHPGIVISFSSPRQYNYHYNSPLPGLLNFLKCACSCTTCTCATFNITRRDLDNGKIKYTSWGDSDNKFTMILDKNDLEHLIEELEEIYFNGENIRRCVYGNDFWGADQSRY
jgi:hypothetical protein